jgi:hypothetical protein
VNFMYLYANDLNVSYIIFFVLFLLIVVAIAKVIFFFISEKVKMNNQIKINKIYLEKESELQELRDLRLQNFYNNQKKD